MWRKPCFVTILMTKIIFVTKFVTVMIFVKNFAMDLWQNCVIILWRKHKLWQISVTNLSQCYDEIVTEIRHNFLTESPFIVFEFLVTEYNFVKNFVTEFRQKSVTKICDGINFCHKSLWQDSYRRPIFRHKSVTKPYLWRNYDGNCRH